MENDEVELPLPSSDAQTEHAATGEDMPLTQTTPCLQISGPVSLNQPLGFFALPSGSLEDSQDASPRNVVFDAGFVPHRRTMSGESREDELQNNGRAEARVYEVREELSVEVQIGRKLRIIGDQIQREHLDRYMQARRGRLTTWWRFLKFLCNIIFPTELLEDDDQ